VIDDVVERVKDKLIFFKYHKVRRDEELVAAASRTEYEYTPCNELLTADWVEWSKMSL
jgi:hypothetical protein